MTKAEPEIVTQSLELPATTIQQPAPPEKRDFTMSEAIEAIRSEDYEPAIDFFAKMTKDRPNYHIGWLRRGYARREWAVRRDPDDRNAAVKRLKLAIRDLTKAAEHVDVEYQALAWYERSKAWYHLGRLEPEAERDRKNYLEDAEKASALSGEKKFLTWLEHVQNFPTP